MVSVINDSCVKSSAISLNTFLDDFRNKFIIKANTPIVVNQMKEYLQGNLTRMYPKLKIDVKVSVKSDHSIYIEFMNNFHNELKIHYPEALF
jgi:hypothetical protein